MNNFMTTFLLMLSLAAVPKPADSCSCMPSHPQEDFCHADFVILANVRKTITNSEESTKIYKIKIKKEFKVTEKSRHALKHNRLLTALEDSMCGVDLQHHRRLYVISGRTYGGQAHISLCGTAKLWSEVGHRQRKGYRLLYSRGCNCTVQSYFGSTRKVSNPDKCFWNVHGNCYRQNGICLRNVNGDCTWTKSLALKKCLYGNDNALWPKKKIEKTESPLPDPYILPTTNRTTTHKFDHRKEDRHPKNTYYQYNQIP